jgi:hypothetical protein
MKIWNITAAATTIATDRAPFTSARTATRTPNVFAPTIATNGIASVLASSPMAFLARCGNSVGNKEGRDMRVKIVAFGYFTSDVHFKVEGGTEGKELKVGNVVGYLDPVTREMVEKPRNRTARRDGRASVAGGFGA